MFVLRSTYLAKVREIADLHLEIHQLNLEALDFNLKLSTQDQTIREMADTIRNTDQLIFQMSQCTDWPAMRPLFNKLQAGQSTRQRAESDRITSIMGHELISIYTKPDGA